jgi:hypothetical protein
MATETNTQRCGMELNVPDAEYRAAEGLSQSALKEFARTPAHYRAYIQTESRQTPAQRLGELVHRAVFQSDFYQQSVVVAPKVNRTTKEGKAAWSQFEAAHMGKEFVSADDAALIAQIVEAVLGHPEAAALLQSGWAEASAWGECPVTGVGCKGRFDWFDEGRILDLKTTEDASPAAFARSTVNLRYHWQAAHYLALAEMIGVPAPQFAWIVVEKSPPFGVALYHLTPEDLERAHSERLALLRSFAECLEQDDWPCYPTAPQALSLPPWAWSKAAAS